MKTSVISMSFQSLLVSADEVSKMMESSPEEIALVDSSWHMGGSRDAFAEYTNCRIPSASFFDIDKISEQPSSLPHMLPSPEFFAQQVGAMGISKDKTVVVYTSEKCFSAARCWWTFKCFGHKKVHILNGGLLAWQSAYAVESGEPKPPIKEVYAAELNTALVKDWRQVLEAVEGSTAMQIVDARSQGRFVGTEPEPRAGLEGGHMPGAKSVPFGKLLVDGDWTTFKSKNEIAQVFTEAGVNLDVDTPIVTTCGSGVTAAILSFGMCLCGKDPSQVPVYDGSWSEWGGRTDLPKTK